jgi:hypothetical protein
MINTEMRLYDYSTTGAKNAYGQTTLNKEVVGQVKMAIYISSQSIQDNINYKDCNYIGLTMADVNDTYVIHYGKEKLKVLYVGPGKLKQVFLKRVS